MKSLRANVVRTFIDAPDRQGILLSAVYTNYEISAVAFKYHNLNFNKWKITGFFAWAA